MYTTGTASSILSKQQSLRIQSKLNQKSTSLFDKSDECPFEKAVEVKTKAEILSKINVQRTKRVSSSIKVMSKNESIHNRFSMDQFHRAGFERSSIIDSSVVAERSQLS